ncbi:hypothetical protein UFOVP1299_40 [uncultured Caudovirales phage]|uniref:Tail fiber protein n=1 Tax=uncultured Caudovirales phage TaxID=2100421 RepID=A0A6J5RNV6_9CAUD|nr:hypothetical protein UFOVP1299_40 [uncultured Caudovirales phage]
MTTVPDFIFTPTALSGSGLVSEAEAMLAALATVQRAATAPATPLEGMLWWDSAAVPDVLKRYTVTAGWIALASVNVTTGALAWYGPSIPTVTAGGTADALTGTFSPALVLADAPIVCVVLSGANTITTPTFAADGGTARTIVKNGGSALVAGDLPASLAVALLKYNVANTRWELLNPAVVPASATASGIVELATDAEAITGTDAVRAVTPAAALAGLQGAPHAFTAGQGCTNQLLTDGATITPNLALQNSGSVLLAGNRTLGIPSGLVAGVRQKFEYDLWQDNTGTRTLAETWGYRWAGGTAGVLSTVPGTRDKLFGDVAYYNTATVTMTIATPGVVTFTGHGFSVGMHPTIQITTTGALPTGLTASTTYWASPVDANTMNLSTSLANAVAGTYIATSGSQSGVHTMIALAIDLSLVKAFS